MASLPAFIPALAIALTIGAAGCDDPFGPRRPILLGITAVEAPADVAAGEAAVVRLTIESGGCRRFEKLEAVRTPGRVTFTARGTDFSGRQVSCPTDIRSDVREYRAEAPLTDPFTVVAKQPNGSETTRTVRVR